MQRQTVVLRDNIIANGRNFSENYSGGSLRSMKLNNCTFHGANFSDAAVTGSKFENCEFSDCEMDQGDFEYSDFIGGSMTSNHPITISFNNSNFVNIDIKDIRFVSSTLTNTFFDSVRFNNVEINNCTLEAVSFYHCSFYNTKLTNLNLDFSEYIDPVFNNCVFPMEQILTTFGLLQYMLTTNTPIELGDHNGNRIIDSDKYINEILPSRLEEYKALDSMSIYGKYFPIINILLAYKQKEEALYYLQKAFEQAAYIDDLRMIRYYCKLISFSELFSYRERKNLYRNIRNHFHMDVMPPWKLKNFSRQIGDIKYTLLNENSLPTLIYYASTNIIDNLMEKMGILTKHIFELSDKYNNSSLHDIRVEITKNSPLNFTIYFTETIENLSYMFKDLMTLSNHLALKDVACMHKENLPGLTRHLQQYLIEYSTHGIYFRYTGSQIENWHKDYSGLFQLEGTV